MNKFQGVRTTVKNGEIKPIEKVESLSFHIASDLEQMEIDPMFFIVEGLLPTGLSILASPPKFGKSWLCMMLSTAVSGGTSFLGFKTNKCGVLYLALEDSYARLQDRMAKVLRGAKANSLLAMSIQCRDLGHGLIQQLEEHLHERPETKLIIIDTFAKIRSDCKRGESAYTQDYREAGVLKQFADSHKICILLVHHTKKMRDLGDIFANISGTMGLTGASDTMIVLSKDDRMDEQTKLSITGRDVDMNEYQMQFDKEQCRWHILGKSEDIEQELAFEKYNNHPIVNTVRKLLQQEKGTWRGTASELIQASRYFQTPIYESAQTLGKTISKLQEELFSNDRILYKSIKNGTGSKIHEFSMQLATVDSVDKY